MSSLVTVLLNVNAVVLPLPVNSCNKKVDELPPPLPAIAPQPAAVYPSNRLSVELYLKEPTALPGLWAVVPTGTFIASVFDPTSKLTEGEVVPIPTPVLLRRIYSVLLSVLTNLWVVFI